MFELCEKAKNALGDKFDIRKFHDEFWIMDQFPSQSLNSILIGLWKKNLLLQNKKGINTVDISS